jgi:hypothetical protein
MAIKDQAKLIVLMVVVGAALMFVVRVCIDILACLAKLALLFLVLYLIHLAST